MKGKVLVIDDDPAWRERLKKLLESAEFHVTTAENLADVKKLLGEEFHFITVDMQLDIDTDDAEKFEGWDILAYLKKFGVQDKTPAMIVTAWPEDYLRLWRAKNLRSIFFMSKDDFDKVKFIADIERAVNSHNLHFKDDKRDQP